MGPVPWGDPGRLPGQGGRTIQARGYSPGRVPADGIRPAFAGPDQRCVDPSIRSPRPRDQAPFQGDLPSAAHHGPPGGPELRLETGTPDVAAEIPGWHRQSTRLRTP